MHDTSAQTSFLTKGSRLTSLLATTIALACSLSSPTWAALGDTVASVSADATKLKATMRVATHAAYTVHELQTPEGVTIREFVSSAGAVFAIAWQGPYKPDPRQLFGRHFEALMHAPRTADSTRTRATIDQPDLVLHSSGHMRAFTGIAYLPQLLPVGVSGGDLQ